MAGFKPSVYVLGGKPEIDLTPTDLNGVFFVPTESRLSIKDPTGAITTYSGGDLILASGYLYVLYHPTVIGWYEYEAWIKDGFGREDTDSRGFEVIDSVY